MELFIAGVLGLCPELVVVSQQARGWEKLGNASCVAWPRRCGAVARVSLEALTTASHTIVDLWIVRGVGPGHLWVALANVNLLLSVTCACMRNIFAVQTNSFV